MSENEDKIKDLEKILNVTQEMSAESNLDSLLTLIMERMKDIIKCDRCTIFILDVEKNELWSKLSTKLEIKEIRIPKTKGIAGEVACSRKPVNIKDAYEDDRFDQEIDKKTGYRTHSILCVPLFNIEKNVVGVIQLLNKLDGNPFTFYDEFILKTFSSQAGVIIERADLYESNLEKEKLSHELELAGNIQKRLLPERSESVNGLEVTGWNISCDDTGGDYFDFFHLEDESTIIAVGDVSGHGISAALVMLEARALFKAFTLNFKNIEDVLNKMNHILQYDLDAEKFMTFFMGHFSKDRTKFVYSSAGHDGPIWFHSKTQKITILDSTSTVLGFMDGVTFPETEVYNTEIGDIFLFCTDGVFEAMNSKNEQYGKDRLVDLIVKWQLSDTSTISDIVKEDLKLFCGNVVARDDITLVLVRIV
ncbi:MAG: hypothetical protein COA79_00370 [Planctomycetota bacterium]|nr:MAG: hypothetical protein COA79_00370 [Planctomycetota bacterium]